MNTLGLIFLFKHLIFNVSKALMIFIKNPEAGNVKTRLASTLGNEKAVYIYKMLLDHTNVIARGVNADKYLFYASYINADDEWNSGYFVKGLQNGDDLGARMHNAFKDLFTDGYENICIIGSDCLEITTDLIDQSFAKLQNSDVVIGPAKDGGYYLLGIKKLHPELFNNISWSTDQVLNQTLAICQRLNLSIDLLPELSDIDVENDFNNLQKKLFLLKNDKP